MSEMAEQSLSITLISDRVIFNESEFIPFESLSVEDTRLLFTTLLENNLKNFLTSNLGFDLFLLLDEFDKEGFLNETDYGNYDKMKVLFYKKIGKYEFLFEKLKNYKYNIIVFADVMGISENSVKDINNLLMAMDNNLVIGNSRKNEICLFGFNHLTSNLSEAVLKSERNYTSFLSLIKTEEYFIHSVNDFIRVNDISSFKELYDDLSQKKSIEYCSQEMHEKFTHLFVEYKDLLK